MATLTEPVTTATLEPKGPATRKAQNVKQRRGGRTAEPSVGRYFLTRGSSNGTVELGQELASENEAMVQSFRESGTYVAVQEWKPTIDLSTGAPIIKKEAVNHDKK